MTTGHIFLLGAIAGATIFLGLPVGRMESLSAGARARIVRLAEHDGDLLHWFYDQELVPGTELVVESADAAADQFVVRLGGGTRAISEKAAAGLFVRPE